MAQPQGMSDDQLKRYYDRDDFDLSILSQDEKSRLVTLTAPNASAPTQATPPTDGDPSPLDFGRDAVKGFVGQGGNILRGLKDVGMAGFDVARNAVTRPSTIGPMVKGFGTGAVEGAKSFVQHPVESQEAFTGIHAAGDQSFGEKVGATGANLLAMALPIGLAKGARAARVASRAPSILRGAEALRDVEGRVPRGPASPNPVESGPSRVQYGHGEATREPFQPRLAQVETSPAEAQATPPSQTAPPPVDLKRAAYKKGAEAGRASRVQAGEPVIEQAFEGPVDRRAEDVPPPMGTPDRRGTGLPTPPNRGLGAMSPQDRTFEALMDQLHPEEEGPLPGNGTFQPEPEVAPGPPEGQVGDGKGGVKLKQSDLSLMNRLMGNKGSSELFPEEWTGKTKVDEPKTLNEVRDDVGASEAANDPRVKEVAEEVGTPIRREQVQDLTGGPTRFPMKKRMADLDNDFLRHIMDDRGSVKFGPGWEKIKKALGFGGPEPEAISKDPFAMKEGPTGRRQFLYRASGAPRKLARREIGKVVDTPLREPDPALVDEWHRLQAELIKADEEVADVKDWTGYDSMSPDSTHPAIKKVWDLERQRDEIGRMVQEGTERGIEEVKPLIERHKLAPEIGYPHGKREGEIFFKPEDATPSGPGRVGMWRDTGYDDEHFSKGTDKGIDLYNKGYDNVSDGAKDVLSNLGEAGIGADVEDLGRIVDAHEGGQRVPSMLEAFTGEVPKEFEAAVKEGEAGAPPKTGEDGTTPLDDATKELTLLDKLRNFRKSAAERAKDEKGSVTGDFLKSAGNVANQLRTTSFLSGLAPIKSILGNVGAIGTNAFERWDAAPLREAMNFPENWKSARDAWKSSANPAAISGSGKINVPGRFMGTLDQMTQDILERSGETTDEGNRLLLTRKDPLGDNNFGKRMKNVAGKAIYPFQRTPFNQVAEGISPENFKDPRGSRAGSARRTALTVAATGAGAVLGSQTKDPRILGLAAALSGPRGIPVLLGAAFGGAGKAALSGASPMPEWGWPSDVNGLARLTGIEPAAIRAYGLGSKDKRKGRTTDKRPSRPATR